MELDHSVTLNHCIRMKTETVLEMKRDVRFEKKVLFTITRSRHENLLSDYLSYISTGSPKSIIIRVIIKKIRSLYILRASWVICMRNQKFFD